ncbi:sulfite exporter TauE/SafE family protein [Halopseudomonas nanhaiensis]|uniref:sulfite exporter TauE/SafE family protein n=1 Tax=Halopseudomonas nanhaiensis TaxID=2830842 RepID=UPI001CC1B714|nr:sulfite exporter TauE/SafE family protein [Halopseudomonas nanhaiensis]UAW97385.1 sulfite exporter TauE/SafE family protein [Halopseudomonas nanhaiensis]
MITDPLFYLCAIPAVLFYGIAKGGFGGNIAILSVPLMALVISPQKAAAILLPILCVMDLVALRTFRGRWDAPNLRIIIPASLVGVVLGALTFRVLNDAHIQVMIGAIAVIFVLNIWLRRSVPPPQGVSRMRGGFWGMVSGFTSFGIHAGGPPINIYLLPQRMEKTILMGTIAVFFTVVNLAKVPAYVYLGQFTSDNLLTSLVLLPLAPIGVRMGFWMLQKTNEQLIYKLCYIFLFITGGKLLYEGILTLTAA